MPLKETSNYIWKGVLSLSGVPAYQLPPAVRAQDLEGGRVCIVEPQEEEGKANEVLLVVMWQIGR